jgi:hypothetical protein
VELSGEHNGAIKSFMDLDRRLELTRKLAKSPSWQQHAGLLQKAELYCLVQSWFYLHTGRTCSSDTVHGFKEVRYTDPETLDFIAAAFPSAKIVLNYRRDVRTQARSGYHKKSPPDKAEAALTRATEVLMRWGLAHPERSFLVATEELNAGNVTALYRWLGYAQCKATSVLQLNAAGGYSSPGDVARVEARSSFTDCSGGGGKSERAGR